MFDCSARDNKDAAVAFFNKWVADVKAHVPEDRLLVFEAKQGWEPLCNFLGVPVPEGPYPRLNDTQALLAEGARAKRIGYAFVLGVSAALVAAVGYFYRDDLSDWFGGM